METYSQWLYDPAAKSFIGSKPKTLESKLRPGYYKLDIGNYGEPIANFLELKKDKMHTFSGEPFISALKEIGQFWDSNFAYENLGVSHKRGILLYGPPGCGKTSLISNIIADVVKRDGIAISISSYNDLENFNDIVPMFRQIQPDTYLVVIIEDLDHLVYDGAQEILVDILDGASSVTDKILFLTTTNKLEKIPDRIKLRPSRIDTLIEIDYPTLAHCNQYVDFLVGKKKGIAKTIRAAIQKEKKLTFADIKEIVISNIALKRSVKDTILKIRKLKKSEEDDED